MIDYELIPSEIAEELEAGSFTVKQRSFIEEYLKCSKGTEAARSVSENMSLSRCSCGICFGFGL